VHCRARTPTASEAEQEASNFPQVSSHGPDTCDVQAQSKHPNIRTYLHTHTHTHTTKMVSPEWPHGSDKPWKSGLVVCAAPRSCTADLLLLSTCPPHDSNIYNCVCSTTSCTLELITTTTTTTTARPTCPPYDPDVYICVCTGSSCILNLLPTTTTTTTTTTTARPTCPPHDSNIYNCVCSATSCQLELITTTIRPTTPFRCPSTGNFPYPGNCYLYYVCAGGGYIVAACPPGQVFNPNISFCENPGNVPGCSYFDIFIYKEALLLADVLTSEQSSFLLVQ